MSISTAWMERLHGDDWTVDPAVFDFKIGFRPAQYVQGNLAASWEFTDPSTYVIHLRQGAHWSNIPPANGREFIADDVIFHYNRMYGLGGGFTKGSPYYTGNTAYQDLISMTATDKYTVVAKWKTPNPEIIAETMQATGGGDFMENPDAVKLWGDENNWHHSIGTGPFLMLDFVSGSSATLVRNPDYYGYDARYPQNKLPYIDTLKILIIPNPATALSALRTGKIDAMEGMSLQDTLGVQKTNPEITRIRNSVYTATTVDPRVDVKPFNDIKVRIAMQKAINLADLASNYYQGTVDPNPLSLTSADMKGWGLPYSQWPQDLKDQYSFDPVAAKKMLADAGYPSGFKTNIVADAGADLDLLQVVKSYFAAVGIDMEIRTMDSGSWVNFVQVGHKQDQMAMRVNGALALNSEPLRHLYRFQTGFSLNFQMVSDPIIDGFVTKYMAATSIDVSKQIVRDANEYVARQHFSFSLVQPNTYSLVQPWFKGYNGQSLAITGTGSGPSCMGFYMCRFWIDQKLKTSSGH
jgi:peptide/nickel transport system substrate-binding protein